MAGPTHPPRALRLARLAVVLIFGGVALYDAGHGLYLLIADQPWLAHGSDTIWASLGSEPARSDPAIISLFRRLGAFQLLAAGVTATFLLLGWRQPRVLDAMLILYLLVGGAFAWGDRTFFAGTTYATSKDLISWLTVAAMLAWAITRWRTRAQAPRAQNGSPERA